ncbi:hypothetical protein Pmi06nite_58960 [Planotetraspora mira]|uniref:Uncharacterized protein n=1 Tax=Planotetraspora mira TaxID=58121 RepID=A0A8J3TUD5_9ACTN|nr:hypothetical protein Pmi06nite_58960 [Planotetraspora mira]
MHGRGDSGTDGIIPTRPEQPERPEPIAAGAFLSGFDGNADDSAPFIRGASHGPVGSYDLERRVSRLRTHSR